jgi:HEAT repeat protein
MKSDKDAHPAVLDPPDAGRIRTSVFQYVVALYTGDVLQREWAIQNLLRKRDKRIITVLIRMMGSRNEKAGVISAIALVRYGARAVRPLIHVLTHRSIRIRRRAVWVLWQIQDRRAVEPLISALRHDPDRKVRRYAAAGLGAVCSPRALNSLILALTDHDDRVRWDAAVSLAKYGSRAVRALIIASQYGEPRVRAGAVNALAWIRDEKTVEVLALALRDKDAHVRARAAYALGWIGDKRAAPLLRHALRDRFSEVRIQAAAALGWLRDETAVTALASLLEDQNEWAAYAAIEALTAIGTPQAVEVLQAAANHHNPFVEETARKAALQLGVNLAKRLAHPRPVRTQLLWINDRNALMERRCRLVITRGGP